MGCITFKADQWKNWFKNMFSIEPDLPGTEAPLFFDGKKLNTMLSERCGTKSCASNCLTYEKTSYNEYHIQGGKLFKGGYYSMKHGIRLCARYRH